MRPPFGFPRPPRWHGPIRACRRRAVHDWPHVDPGLVLPAAASRSAAYAAVRDLLRRPDAPTALLSATDRAAVDGIWAARDLGVAVPGDLAVIGIGNIPEGMMISSALTTVGTARLAFSREVDRLFERLGNVAPLPGEEFAAPWELIVRESG
ncbi:substrate-binding domain-containing protein [Pseudonocardia xinjiangensis]|uniref:substrate-binding domain-containing protein n=1 Tax=Pseudonocardia xinjiangensis TaxID=75289 RepID=UPI003D8C6A3B